MFDAVLAPGRSVRHKDFGWYAKIICMVHVRGLWNDAPASCSNDEADRLLTAGTGGGGAPKGG